MSGDSESERSIEMCELGAYLGRENVILDEFRDGFR
jgi:hypothetical protein